MTKICSKCKIEKDVSEFGPKKHKNGKIYLNSWCKSCTRQASNERRKRDVEAHNKSRRDYYQRNKERLRAKADKEKEREKSRLRRMENPEKALQQILTSVYHTTLEHYYSMLKEQKGKCACCGKNFDESKREPCIDHDHACCPGRKSCGKCIRGLLCRVCNISLGFVEKNQHLIAYLEGRTD